MLSEITVSIVKTDRQVKQKSGGAVRLLYSEFKVNDTPDGKCEFHGTVQGVIQRQSSSNISSLKKSIKIECSYDTSLTFNYNDMFCIEVIKN